jgi:tRNA pseudouridine38-40 synthase
MPRLKLTVAYDGTVFAGWQSQVHRNTVQDKLERAFNEICGAHVRVHGAGRTDAGVHALAQCAHVDLPIRRLSAGNWTTALNATLPPTLRVLRCRFVSPQFHARFSATGKTYRYRIWSAPILPPLELHRVWHIPQPIDVELLIAAGRMFVGKHNFAAYAANRGKKEENTVRTISLLKVRWRRSDVAIEISGDGFLYKMVRLMVGAMIRVSLGKMRLEEIESGLRTGRPNGSRNVAPSYGLYLVKVWY